jgi:hypothetical protein
VSKDGDTEAVEEGKCSDFIKPNSEEYCNVHNPCPGEGKNFILFRLIFHTQKRTSCNKPAADL